MSSEEEKQELYILKQEIGRFKEDNLLLKAENDRLIKLLYDKEKE